MNLVASNCHVQVLITLFAPSTGQSHHLGYDSLGKGGRGKLSSSSQYPHFANIASSYSLQAAFLIYRWSMSKPISVKLKGSWSASNRFLCLLTCPVIRM